MAEAFGILTAAISTLDVAIRTAKSLREFYKATKDAPNLIFALANDIEDFGGVLCSISEAEKSIKQLGCPENDKFVQALQRPLQRAQSLLRNLEEIAERLTTLKTSSKRIQWYLRRSHVASLKERLKEVKEQLIAILISYGMCVLGASSFGDTYISVD
jgi:hypothetical protein